jgi:hypothetical protein
VLMRLTTTLSNVIVTSVNFALLRTVNTNITKNREKILSTNSNTCSRCYRKTISSSIFGINNIATSYIISTSRESCKVVSSWSSIKLYNINRDFVCLFFFGQSGHSSYAWYTINIPTRSVINIIKVWSVSCCTVCLENEMSICAICGFYTSSSCNSSCDSGTTTFSIATLSTLSTLYIWNSCSVINRSVCQLASWFIRYNVCTIRWSTVFITTCVIESWSRSA